MREKPHGCCPVQPGFLDNFALGELFPVECKTIEDVQARSRDWTK